MTVHKIAYGLTFFVCLNYLILDKLESHKMML